MVLPVDWRTSAPTTVRSLRAGEEGEKLRAERGDAVPGEEGERGEPCGEEDCRG